MNKQKAWRAQAAKVNATYKAKFNEVPPPGFARTLLKKATTILATPSPLFQRLLKSVAGRPFAWNGSATGRISSSTSHYEEMPRGGLDHMGYLGSRIAAKAIAKESAESQVL